MATTRAAEMIADPYQVVENKVPLGFHGPLKALVRQL